MFSSSGGSPLHGSGRPPRGETDLWEEVVDLWVEVNPQVEANPQVEVDPRVANDFQEVVEVDFRLEKA